MRQTQLPRKLPVGHFAALFAKELGQLFIQLILHAGNIDKILFRMRNILLDAVPDREYLSSHSRTKCIGL